MKKVLLTLTCILGISIGTFAQGGGLFGRGDTPNYSYSYRDDSGNNTGLLLPDDHGTTKDYDAPLGSGALLLIGFGAAYALKRQQNKK